MENKESVSSNVNEKGIDDQLVQNGSEQKKLKKKVVFLKAKIEKSVDIERVLETLSNEVETAIGNGSLIDLELQMIIDLTLLQKQSIWLKICVIIASIRFLTLNIRCNLCDQQQSQAICVLFKELRQCYRFNLQIISPHFSEDAAKSLEEAFSQLKSVEIFSLVYVLGFIGQQHQRARREWFESLCKGIGNMPNLQIAEFDFFNPSRAKSTKLAQYKKWIHSDSPNQKIFADFIAEIKPIEHKITHVVFTDDFRGFDDDMQGGLIVSMLEHCFHNLKYMTYLRLTFGLNSETKVYSLFMFLTDYLKKKSNVIQHLLAFEEFFSPFLPINPKLVALDLYF